MIYFAAMPFPVTITFLLKFLKNEWEKQYILALEIIIYKLSHRQYNITLSYF